jgi:hypothetical protein
MGARDWALARVEDTGVVSRLGSCDDWLGGAVNPAGSLA